MSRLGILLLSDPAKGDLSTIEGLCRAAGEEQVDVELFLMGDGIHYLGDPRLTALAESGVRVSFCALNAQERLLDRRTGYPFGLEEGSQYQLACILEGANKFLAFA